ncbi:hypothetical protein ILYODFUR_018775 [Ilyodon furcidens]|uniref:Uncharacterized protein n=1 Tax=Ilyodon furcidens TaxID=33524 RepID=A0ABV0V472_9TELE
MDPRSNYAKIQANDEILTISAPQAEGLPETIKEGGLTGCLPFWLDSFSCSLLDPCYIVFPKFEQREDSHGKIAVHLNYFGHSHFTVHRALYRLTSRGTAMHTKSGCSKKEISALIKIAFLLLLPRTTHTCRYRYWRTTYQ